MNPILEDYLEDVELYHALSFNKYEPSEKANVRFNFLRKVTTSHFCDSRHVQVDKNGVLAEKTIELFENEHPERTFTIIDRTRLHVGTLESDMEMSDYGDMITGQNFLREKNRFTVYILSDGFNKKFKALSEHLTLIT